MKRLPTLLLATAAICSTACQTPVLDIEYRSSSPAQFSKVSDAGVEVPAARDDDLDRWLAIVLDAGPTGADSAAKTSTDETEETNHGDASSSNDASNGLD
jgi:hypothetical protein